MFIWYGRIGSEAISFPPGTSIQWKRSSPARSKLRADRSTLNPPPDLRELQTGRFPAVAYLVVVFMRTSRASSRRRTCGVATMGSWGGHYSSWLGRISPSTLKISIPSEYCFKYLLALQCKKGQELLVRLQMSRIFSVFWNVKDCGFNVMKPFEFFGFLIFLNSWNSSNFLNSWNI